MSNLPTGYRVDPLSGASVYVVANRQARPNQPTTSCPFCPGGLEAPDDYDVRWFPNRWPPFPDQRAEIVLYTSEHDTAFWKLTQDHARRVVDVWAERTTALGGRPDVRYVLVFENRGPEVGATIPHPHGQIYGFEQVPPAPLTELDPARVDALHADAQDDRLVAMVGSWRAWVPSAANWPYEMVLAPRVLVPDLPALDGEGREDLAGLLRNVFGRLDRIFDEAMPYMFWFHQRPTDGNDWPTAWLHAHVAPLYRSPGTPRFVAAGELGSGVFFNPVDPIDAAARLREA